jgi:hypothetical protein
MGLSMGPFSLPIAILPGRPRGVTEFVSRMCPRRLDRQSPRLPRSDRALPWSGLEAAEPASAWLDDSGRRGSAMTPKHMHSALALLLFAATLSFAGPPSDRSSDAQTGAPRDTRTARGLLAGTWTSEDSRQIIHFKWPDVVTISIEPVESGESGDKSSRSKANSQPKLVRRVTRWTVTMGVEGKDRATMKLGMPNPLRSAGPYVVSGYELQFDFAPDASFAMVTKEGGALGRYGPGRYNWSPDQAPAFASADTPVWLKPDATRPNFERLFHRERCPVLKKEKGKLTKTTLGEAQSKFSYQPCEMCGPQLVEPAAGGSKAKK